MTMNDGRRSSLLAHFVGFVSTHRRCGNFVWNAEEREDGVGIDVTARCLGCDALFLESATESEVASALVHSALLTSAN